MKWSTDPSDGPSPDSGTGHLARRPAFIYGTAWKELSTAALVHQALEAGFRAIDTANQKRHYLEDFAGEALRDLDSLGIKRSDLFLQSKYTYVEGQDHRLPYDPKTACTTQVRDSFASTLRHLHTDYLDSYLLHGPRTGGGLTPEDWEVWAAMEALQESGKTLAIGISNVSLRQLAALCEKARIRPAFVQNRCYAIRGWDAEVREFCLNSGITYQGFSLLTANPQVVSSRTVKDIAHKYGATAEQVVFAFSIRIGILPLTGTTDPKHMRQDLEAPQINLSNEEINAVGNAYSAA